jgi:hypothetical protein
MSTNTNNIILCWMGVPFDNSFCTYKLYDYKEHQILDKYKKYKTLDDLKEGLSNGNLNINSPTACYFNLEYETGMFYIDQQGCVTWYLKEDGSVMINENQCVAKSLAEFLSHIEHDSKKWYTSNY